MFNINTQSPYSVAQLFKHKKNFFEHAIIISCVFVLMFYIEILKHFFRWASIIKIEFSKYKVLFVFFSLKKVTLIQAHFQQIPTSHLQYAFSLFR